jgi:hypothetical protein
MRARPTQPPLDDSVREFVEQLLRTGRMLTGVLDSLLEDIPEDAFPGESLREVLVDMMSGTVRPAAQAAGAGTLAHCTALLGAVADRTVADLRAALDRAGGGA